MAEEDSAQDKTEDPTSRRLSKAREQGQVPRSRELDTLIMLLVSGLSLLVLGAYMVDGLLNIMRTSMIIERENIFDTRALTSFLKEGLLGSLYILGPFFVVMIIAAICAPMAIGGRTFSTEPLMLNFARMDPVKGLSRIFAWKGAMELAKALVKFILVGSIGAVVLYHKIPEFMSLSELSVREGVIYMGSQLLWVFLILSASLILVAVVDVPFQRWDYRQQLRMTRQQVRDEVKDTEGNPQVKHKIRRKQLEAIARRMMAEVPKADVVVTNPTHYAVALRYDQQKMGAPVVVASGVNEIAGHIRRIALATNVPLLEAPSLARALYYSTELGDEIPEGLYLAIAQVLAYVYQLNQFKEHGGERPKPSPEYPIPDDLRRDH